MSDYSESEYELATANRPGDLSPRSATGVHFKTKTIVLIDQEPDYEMGIEDDHDQDFGQQLRLNVSAHDPGRRASEGIISRDVLPPIAIPKSPSANQLNESFSSLTLGPIVTVLLDGQDVDNNSDELNDSGSRSPRRHFSRRSSSPFSRGSITSQTSNTRSATNPVMSPSPTPPPTVAQNVSGVASTTIRRGRVLRRGSLPTNLLNPAQSPRPEKGKLLQPSSPRFEKGNVLMRPLSPRIDINNFRRASASSPRPDLGRLAEVRNAHSAAVLASPQAWQASDESGGLASSRSLSPYPHHWQIYGRQNRRASEGTLNIPGQFSRQSPITTTDVKQPLDNDTGNVRGARVIKDSANKTVSPNAQPRPGKTAKASTKPTSHHAPRRRRTNTPEDLQTSDTTTRGAAATAPPPARRNKSSELLNNNSAFVPIDAADDQPHNTDDDDDDDSDDESLIYDFDEDDVDGEARKWIMSWLDGVENSRGQMPAVSLDDYIQYSETKETAIKVCHDS